MIFMTHEKHGAMNVVSNSDAAVAEANGWKRSTEAEWLGINDEPVEPDVTDEPVAAEPKKRGRPAKAE